MKKKNISIWLIGLSGSGKTSIGKSLMNRLRQLSSSVILLDGDAVRKGMNNDLGFSYSDRIENIRRVSELNNLLLHSGVFVINCFICPTIETRDIARSIIGEENMIICHLDTPLNICESRDVKGLYKKARKGEIDNFTGINSMFQTPKCDLVLKAGKYSIDECVNMIMDYLKL